MMTVDELKKLFHVEEDQELGPIFGRKKGAVSVWRKDGVPASIERKARELLSKKSELKIQSHEDLPYIEEAPGHYRSEPEPAPSTVKIPLYRALGSCGPGVINHNDEVETWMSFTTEFARATFGTAGKGLASLRATGDSMKPTITEGDVIVMNTDENSLTRDGSMYVLQMGETTLVKRLQRMPGSMVRVASDNPAAWSKDLTIDEIEAEGLRIIGRVVFVGRLA